MEELENCGEEDVVEEQATADDDDDEEDVVEEQASAYDDDDEQPLSGVVKDDEEDI